MLKKFIFLSFFLLSSSLSIRAIPPPSKKNFHCANLAKPKTGEIIIAGTILVAMSAAIIMMQKKN